MNKLKLLITPTRIALVIFYIFSLCSLWYLHPLTNRVNLHASNINSKQTLDCVSKIGSTLFTNLDLLNKSGTQYVDGTVLSDQTELEVTIDKNSLTVYIDPQYTKDAKPPKKWSITSNTSTYILAQGIDTNDYNQSASSFALNKETGFAVWTKAEPTALNASNPNATMYYFECK